MTTLAWLLLASIAAASVLTALSVRTHPQSLVPKFASRWGRG